MCVSHSTRGLIALALALGISCGDEDQGADVPASVRTGLPLEQTLASFDDDDAKAACRALNDGASELITDLELVRAQCASHAIRRSATIDEAKTQVTLDLARCDMLTANCQADPSSFGVKVQGARDESDCNQAVANTQVASCEATVGEYEACISSVLTQARYALSSTSCANGKKLIESDGAETKVEPKNITECNTFLSKCPDVQVTVTIGE